MEDNFALKFKNYAKNISFVLNSHSGQLCSVQWWRRANIALLFLFFRLLSFFSTFDHDNLILYPTHSSDPAAISAAFFCHQY